jgi:hexosaminidase
MGVQKTNAQNKPALIPYPQQLDLKGGNLVIPAEAFYLIQDSVFNPDFEWFKEASKEYKNTNWKAKDPRNKMKAFFEIRLSNDSEIKENGYRLKIDESIVLTGKGSGIFYGLQTLMQLIYEGNKNGTGAIPKCVIEDAPRFAWRGMHLDVSRHFFGVNTVKKMLDLMAGYKLNTFHWHLTDDQGWRIEIKKYPKLMVQGAYRAGSMVGPYDDQKFDTIVYGGYYTQKEIQEVVAYAKKLHITVVPEIEMPGHAMAALASYPELACFPKDFKTEKGWGVFDDVFCTKKESFDFLYNVLDEVCSLFPGEYIHIGGDECPKTRWHECGNCQNNLKAHGLKNEEELQRWFITQIKKHVEEKGKKIIGWDEILDGGPTPGAAIMSWRGESGGIAAAKQQQKVVMTPGSHCYFDHYQGNPQLEPLAIGGYTPIEKVYAYEPIPVALSKEEAKFIMGAQANVWTEYILDEEQLINIVLPRLPALAEVLWGKATGAQTGEFIRRFLIHAGYLQTKNIGYSKAMFQVNERNEKGEEPGSIKVSFSSIMTEVTGFNYKIYGIINKAKPELISSPLKFYSPSEVKVYVGDENGRPAGKIFQQMYLVNAASSALIDVQPYPAKVNRDKGLFVLTDGTNGNFKPRINDGWLGWDTSMVQIKVDLGVEKVLSNVVISYLHDPKVNVFAPDSIQLEYSADGIKFFKPLMGVSISKPTKRESARFQLSKPSARYLRLNIYQAKREGTLGKKRWLMLDEIITN